MLQKNYSYRLSIFEHKENPFAKAKLKYKTMLRLFKNKNKEEKPSKDALPWKNLTEINQLDTLLEESELHPVFIFKHSTRCGISRMVLNRFESELEATDDYGMYYLDLLAYRDISNAVAEKFQVHHQSPQLIVLHHAEVVHHSSHQSIGTKVLEELVIK